MKRIFTAGLAIALSITSISPAKGNPALLAPTAGLCGTGIGCVLVGTVIIGGIVYYVYSHQGRKFYVRKDDLHHNRVESRAISGMEAHKRGDAHWAADREGCDKIGKRIKKSPIAKIPALGNGFWCIFPGEQTSFGEE